MKTNYMSFEKQYETRLLNSIKSKTFDADVEIEYLCNNGYSREDAQLLITKQILTLREAALEKGKQAEGEFEEQKAAIILTIIISIIGPIFEITSPIYYLIVILVAGALGYWGYKRTPIAGVVGCVLAVILMPIFFMMYISGRTSIVKIELLIPILLASVPSFLVSMGLAKLLYPNKE